MFSDFDDPAPILTELGTANAIDSEANYYEATATWEYRNLLPNGTWGIGKMLKKPSKEIEITAETESRAGKTIPSPMISAKTTKKSPTLKSTEASNDSLQNGLFWNGKSKWVIDTEVVPDNGTPL